LQIKAISALSALNQSFKSLKVAMLIFHDPGPFVIQIDPAASF